MGKAPIQMQMQPRRWEQRQRKSSRCWSNEILVTLPLSVCGVRMAGPPWMTSPETLCRTLNDQFRGHCTLDSCGAEAYAVHGRRPADDLSSSLKLYVQILLLSLLRFGHKCEL